MKKSVRKAWGGGRSNSLLPKVLVVSLIVILSFGSLFVSCDDTLTLQSIKVTQKPTAEYQYLGESLDTTGMVVTGYYNKGYESVIADYTVSPEKFETLGTNTVTVSYKGKTDSFEVNVVRNDLESITIKNPPNKIAYKSGEKLNLTGLVVEGKYKDGTVETITGYTTTPVEGTELKTTNKKVIISYQDKTTEQSIVVEETPEPTPTPVVVTFDSKDGTTVSNQVVLSGACAVEPADPTKNNYEFDGWYTEDTYANKYIFSTPVTANLTLYAKWIDVKNRVGGKIFYIADSNNDATYKFYQQDGSEITNWSKPTDLVNAYYYTKSGTSTADKFYVYYETVSGYKYWTYYDTTNSDWKYESLGTEDGIGKGKTNTSTVMAKDSGAYIKSATTMGQSYDTIWYYIDSLNKANGGVGTEGCDDWFMPSKAELNELKTYTGYDKDEKPTAGTNSGNPNWFDERYIWSSVEDDSYYAWLWYCDSGVWDYSIKFDTGNVVAVRAF